jgi:hypothetical protein
MWEHGRSFPSLITGSLLFLLGLIPLLSQIGLIGFKMPESIGVLVGNIDLYLIAAGGCYLLIDGFLQWGNPMAWVTFILAVAVLIIGIIPLLNQFGVIGFTIPFLSLTVYYILFVIEGIFLAIGAFLME